MIKRTNNDTILFSVLFWYDTTQRPWRSCYKEGTDCLSVHYFLADTTNLPPGAICPRSSCAGRCGAILTLDGNNCSCDLKCPAIGDCCRDVWSRCQGQTDDLNHRDSYLASGISRFHATRTSLPKYLSNVSQVQFTKMTLNAVHSCPELSHHADDCNDIWRSLRHDTPVCVPAKQLFFRNQFCAICHGYRMEDIVPFVRYVELAACTEDVLLENGTVLKGVQVDNLVRKCATGFHANHCPDDCREATNRMTLARYSIHPLRDSDQCRSFLEPIVVEGYEFVWRNPYCAPNDTPVSCYHGQYQTSTSAPFYSFQYVVPIHFDESGSPVAVLDQHSESSGTPCRPGRLPLFLFSCIVLFIYIWTSLELRIRSQWTIISGKRRL